MLLGSRNRTAASLSFLLFVIFSIASMRQMAWAEPPVAREESPTDVSSAVDMGVEQERAHHWLEAIETYEKALKQ
jgi:hypothetical protein